MRRTESAASFISRRNKREQCLKKYISLFMLVAVVALILSPFRLGNTYLRSSSFDTITVEKQDNVWGIASRYSENNSQIKELTEAIIEVNGLSADGNIKAGQKIQVPVLKKSRTFLQMAEK